VNLRQLLDRLKEDQSHSRCITAWESLPARPARYGPWPAGLRPAITAALADLGINRLYSHQSAAVTAALDGRDVVIVTPTASGKTLCYNLPVLNSILADPAARALYLFPTKALAQDQLSALLELSRRAGGDIKACTYDGDTPPDARQAIRNAGHIVITNPDMLHTGIMPHHTRWIKLFENLRYIVIDEIHNYRGVFGSHVANVLRRLDRICRFYGAKPTYVCCSATIANPGDLARRLCGRAFEVIDDNGAPQGPREFIVYNPPVVNRELGIRRSCLLQARDLSAMLLRNGIQTIIFGRTRLAVEVLLTYLRRSLAQGRSPGTQPPPAVRGYRGGYLPRQRREIERGLREGSVLGVVATTALELGVDIGRLQAAVLTGYPGTIAGTWQQAGRAGRTTALSCTILVASSSPLDQYIAAHPHYFFGRSPEEGLIDPDNLLILAGHIKCAAFELPFSSGEEFGRRGTQEILEYLAEQGLIYQKGGRWYWMADAFPAEDISLRSAAAENVVIIDTTATGSPRVIGEVDRFSAPMLVHEEAVYIHEGRQYQVERLDFEENKAYVRQVDVDYYTDANLAVDLRVLDVFDSAADGLERARGEVSVTALATIFKKIKLHTHENVGSGHIRLPEQRMHTQAAWLALPPEVTSGIGRAELEAGLAGLGRLAANVAPIYLMCDPRDLGVSPQVRSPFTGLPTIYLYDAYPGGVGLSHRVYSLVPELLRAVRRVAADCPCSDGCPSCVGPPDGAGPGAKAPARLILDRLIDAGRAG